MTPLELAWAAGMFEGEGSVRINKATKRNHGALLCDMSNTIPEVCAFFAEHWGGTLKHIDAPAPRRAFWRWRVAARAAARFLRDIRPYVRTERYRRRVDLGLEYQEQKRSGHNRTVAYLAAQERYYEEMRALNVRGRVDDSEPVLPPLVHPRAERLALFALDRGGPP